MAKHQEKGVACRGGWRRWMGMENNGTNAANGTNTNGGGGENTGN